MYQQEANIELVVVGGSAGCLPILLKILKSLDKTFKIPVAVVIHRQRNVNSEMAGILAMVNPAKPIIEPDDKEIIGEGCIYLAPQNYHLLIENDRSFSLDYSEAIQYSRPSIDVTFESAAQVYKNKLVGIVLSGANNDGATGLQSVIQHGGIAIAQDPTTAEYPVMPHAAIERVEGIKVLAPEKIAAFLNALS